MATMVHADPPYGMRKSGVANDNLTGKRLDAFQMAWWEALRPHLKPNASAYIWGNAPDLWRLWYGSLVDSEPLTIRNEIVWDKLCCHGRRDPDKRMYTTGSERCLFFVRGLSVWAKPPTAQAYWPGWEPIRTWLCNERKTAGFTPTQVKRICGNNMFSHWFFKAQWMLINRAGYEKLAAAAAGTAFTRPYEDLEAEYSRLKAVYDAVTRPVFNNVHDAMYDVWHHPVVVGEDRFGHETPKPVALAERAIKTSSREGDIIAVPFGGSGPEIIAAERTGRACRVMELVPFFADVIVKRWMAETGQQAFHQDGRTFADVAAARCSA